MATIRCPLCGYTETDGRPQDKETYVEECASHAKRKPSVLRSESAAFARAIEVDAR